jgi:pimeloyl-ACP methyl ester carboxylesterase
VGEVRPAADDWLDELDAMVAAGDRAVEIFAGAANITDDELQTNRSKARVWAGLRDAVRTAGREIRGAKAVLPIDKELLGSISVPTLVLLGAEQDHPTYKDVRGLADQLTFGKLERVPGHHLALVFAPDALIATIRSFLAVTS